MADVEDFGSAMKEEISKVSTCSGNCSTCSSKCRKYFQPPKALGLPFQELARRIALKLTQFDDIILIMSGKGGVGKSTLAVQVAYYYSEVLGHTVDLLDCDVCGPSAASLTASAEADVNIFAGEAWEPVHQTMNLSIMSPNYLIGPKDTAIILPGTGKDDIISEMFYRTRFTLRGCEGRGDADAPEGTPLPSILPDPSQNAGGCAGGACCGSCPPQKPRGGASCGCGLGELKDAQLTPEESGEGEDADSAPAAPAAAGAPEAPPAQEAPGAQEGAKGRPAGVQASAYQTPKCDALHRCAYCKAAGKRNVLLVDLPPGTSDEQLTAAQFCLRAMYVMQEEASAAKAAGRDAPERPLSVSALVVSTPQEVALQDVRRVLRFCQTLRLPVAGVVENMSGFVCPSCNTNTDVFWPSTGGCGPVCEKYGVRFLGKLPLCLSLSRACDEGMPWPEYLGTEGGAGDEAAYTAFCAMCDSVLGGERS